MLPDFISLQLFARVAETHNITRAAEAMHIALAAASRRLAMLEEQYGVRLLERSSRGAELTTAGRAAHVHVRRLLAQAEELRVELSEHARGHRGRITVHANQSSIAQMLPRDLAAFGSRVPTVSIVLEERSSGEAAQAVRDGAVDIGIVMEGTSLDGIESFPYAADRLVAIVPREHAVRARRVHFASLLPFDMVGLDVDTAITRLLSDQAALIGKPLRLRVQVRSFSAQARMVQAGLGIGILPEGAARPMLRALDLRIMDLTDEWATRRVFVCVREYEKLAALPRQLVDHLVSRVPRAHAAALHSG